MPTVLRVDGYRFGFYASDRGEPIHVHVAKAGLTAKYWLQPVRLEKNFGFAQHELNAIERIIAEHLTELIEAWHEFFRA